jgi:hypothetical protein
VKALVRNPEAVAALVKLGAAMGGAVIVSVKLPVAVPAAPVAEIEMLGNEAGLASKGTVPEITPVVVFRNK